MNSIIQTPAAPSGRSFYIHFYRQLIGNASMKSIGLSGRLWYIRHIKMEGRDGLEASEKVSLYHAYG